MSGARFHRIFFHAALLLLPFIFSPACKKNKDCDVVISVLNGNNSLPIYGATVHMHPPSATNPSLETQDQTGITDAAGSATFTFKLPAILQADVTAPSNYNLNSGGALVKLEEGKKVSKTVTLY